MENTARTTYNISGGINMQSLQIVENVLQYCKTEKLEGKLLAGNGMLSAYKERTSEYTGVPLSVIESNYKEDSSPVPELSLSVRLAIRRILKKYYSKGELPNGKFISDIYDMLKAQQYLCALTLPDFKIQLNRLGYENVKTCMTEPADDMIMENPRVTFERLLYIKRIMKARNIKQKIYYLDLRTYDTEKKLMVPLKDEKDSKSNYLVLCYIISKDGYESGLFSYSFDQNSFTNWILNILMAVLHPSSLIVINNNILNGNFEHSSLTRYHSKKDMLQWLKSQGVPCIPTMRKPELFELIEKCPTKVENNNLENILKCKGHDVIHIPDHIQMMTPSEFLWQNVDEKTKNFENLLSPSLLKDKIAEIISCISKDTWNRYDQIIKEIEENFYVVDTEIENYLDKFKLDFDAIFCDGSKMCNHLKLS